MLLTTEDLRAAGVDAPWTWGWRDSVRFSEVDRLGHVNNLAYVEWIETLRVRWFVATGLTGYGPDDPWFVVRRQNVDYLRETAIFAEYLVVQRVAHIGTSSFTLASEIRVDGRLHATAEVVVVQVRDGAKAALTPETRARLT